MAILTGIYHLHNQGRALRLEMNSVVDGHVAEYGARAVGHSTTANASQVVVSLSEKQGEQVALSPVDGHQDTSLRQCRTVSAWRTRGAKVAERRTLTRQPFVARACCKEPKRRTSQRAAEKEIQSWTSFPTARYKVEANVKLYDSTWRARRIQTLFYQCQY